MKVVQREQGPFEAVLIRSDNLEEVKALVGSKLRRYSIDNRGQLESVTFDDNYSDYPTTASRGDWIVNDLSCEGLRALDIKDFREQFRIVEDELEANHLKEVSSENS